MQVNVAGLRRNIKNLAHNYSDAQVKVREATSNDPWGPSATIMAEIADLTYNVVAFSEIMQMIWKRLNDHGKNWRHVYKALILLEYLIKTGTEKVSQQCKENIYAIQTLREFVYFEEGKDQGTHVREKAKQLVILLKDDERLKNERAKALKAKERFAQHPSGFGSDGYIDGPLPRDLPPGWQEEPTKPVSDLELVRPQTAGEEELQLQLAMAMSREEAEQEEAKRRSDDVRLQLALSQSEQDFNEEKTTRPHGDQKEEPQSHLLDLLDISLGATSISSPPLGATSDPWGTPARAASQLSDPWTGTASPPVDPWQPASTATRNAVGLSMANGGGGGGAVGGIGVPGENWTGVRTQSPSITSGSSNEGWLHSNGLNGAIPQQAPVKVADPWEAKGAAGPIPAVQTTTDPWRRPDNPQSATPVMQSVTDKTVTLGDPWAPKTQPPNTDPWRNTDNTTTKKPSPDLDEFDIISNRNKSGTIDNNVNNNNSKLLLSDLDPLSATNNSAATTVSGIKKPLKDPQDFLGENSALVNLDNLIKPAVPHAQVGNNTAAYNPFSDSNVIPPKANLFQQPPVPSINQLKQQQPPFAMAMNQDPWAPVANTNTQLIQYDSINNNNTNAGFIQNRLHTHYDPFITNTIDLSNPYHSNSNNNNNNNNVKNVNMMRSKSDYEAFQGARPQIVPSMYPKPLMNDERLTQSINNMRSIPLTDNDNDDMNSSRYPQYPSYPSLYPQVKIINNNTDNRMQSISRPPQLLPQSSLSLASNFLMPNESEYVVSNSNSNSNTNDIYKQQQQTLGSVNISRIPIASQPPQSLHPQLPTTTSTGRTAATGTAFSGSRSAAFVSNQSQFTSNYCNDLQASLANTPGVTIKPLLHNESDEISFSECFYDCNDNVNANTSNTESKLDGNNKNNNNSIPWVKPESASAASNPFLS